MQPARPSVLVVEDDPVTDEILCTLLEQAGYAVEHAANGAAGLARIEAGGIDLVLLDLMLPDLDGLELCRRVRAREGEVGPRSAAVGAYGVYLPIIMLTALADGGQRRSGFAAGADDYVTKPFNTDELLDRVQVWVQARQRLRAVHERLLVANTREQKLLEETEERARSLRALHEVAVAASGVLDPAALARLVVDHARDLLGVDAAALYWWDADAALLHRLAHNRADGNVAAPTLRAGQGAIGLALQRREPVIVADYQAWEHALPWSTAAGLSSVVAVPLLVGDRAIGVLGVDTYAPRHFEPEQVQLLSLFAAQVAPALEAARLHAESERRRAEAEALAELARRGAAAPDTDRVIGLIAEQACRLVGADYAAVALIEPDGTASWRGVWGNRTDAWDGPATRFSRGEGTTGRALAAARTVVLERLGDNPDLPIEEFPRHRREGGRTALATPLFGRAGPLGALVLGWRSDVSLTTAQVRLAEALASYAATILDNARAHAEAAAHAEKLRRLAEISAVLLAETDLAVVLDQIVQTAAQAVGLEHNSLLLVDDAGRTLSHAATVGLPADYVQAVDGIAIGPTVGTCGAAAFRGETVITEDLLADPNWEAFRHLAAPHGYRAVWSVPLLGKGGKVLGTFAAYNTRPGRPTPGQLELLALYARLAAVAVENAHSLVRERHLAREAAAREAELAAVLEQMPSGVVVLDATGRVVLRNEAGRRIVGTLPDSSRSLAHQIGDYQVQEPVTGRPLAPEEMPVVRALAGEPVQEYELLLRPTGEREDRWIQTSAVPLRDAEGRVTGTVAVFSDVTRERKLMRELAASEQRLRTLYQAMACGVLVQSATGEILDGNEAAERIIGLTLDRMRGRILASLWKATREDGSDLSAAERPGMMAVRNRLLVRNFPLGVSRPDGKRRWLLVDAVPVLGADGEPEQVVTSFIDITALKRAEEEAERERREKLALLDSTGEGIYGVDLEGRCTFMNRAGAALLGYQPDEVLGKPMHELIHYRRGDSSPYPREECPIYRAFQSGRGVRVDDEVFWRRDGTDFPAEYSAYPIIEGQMLKGTVVTFSDITDRRRAEEERRRLIEEIERERAALAAVMASMSDGLMLIDSAQQIRYANPRVGELMGTDPEPFIGERVDAAFAAVREAFTDPEAAGAAWEEAQARLEARPSFEVTLAGTPRRDVLVQLFPVADVGGSGSGVGIVLRDVTGAKLLALLRERERIAMDLHDGVIQSLYAVVLGLGARERALQRSEQVAPTREALREAIAQINDVIREIRNYIFDLRPHEMGERGLRAGLEALVEELRINALVRPELALDGEAEGLLGRDAVANLLQIAREATANVIRHAAATAVKLELRRADGQLVLTVGDNGRGFELESADTRSGQGLGNMAERARMLGGRLAVWSQLGRGTEVRLEVPLRERTVIG